MINFFERHNKLSWLITIIGAVFIFYFSSRTFQLGKIGLDLTAIVYHFYAFFLFSAFLLISLAKGKMNKKKILIGIFIAIIYAFSDEIHQFFVLGRDANLFDVMTDSTGVLFASVLYILSFKFRK